MHRWLVHFGLLKIICSSRYAEAYKSTVLVQLGWPLITKKDKTKNFSWCTLTFTFNLNILMEYSFSLLIPFDPLIQWICKGNKKKKSLVRMNYKTLPCFPQKSQTNLPPAIRKKYITLPLFWPTPSSLGMPKVIFLRYKLKSMNAPANEPSSNIYETIT